MCVLFFTLLFRHGFEKLFFAFVYCFLRTDDYGQLQLLIKDVISVVLLLFVS